MEEEILLALVCQEFDIEEDFLFSGTRCDRVQNPIGMLIYLLSTEYGKSILEIHHFFKKHGYTKTRPTLYTNLRRGERNLKRFQSYRDLRDSLIEGVEIAKEHGVVEGHEQSLYEITGRIIAKLMQLESKDFLFKLERATDNFLKSEFIETKQYEKPKDKTWIFEKTQSTNERQKAFL